jgi:hypothetical protein
MQRTQMGCTLNNYSEPFADTTKISPVSFSSLESIDPRGYGRLHRVCMKPVMLHIYLPALHGRHTGLCSEARTQHLQIYYLNFVLFWLEYFVT